MIPILIDANATHLEHGITLVWLIIGARYATMYDRETRLSARFESLCLAWTFRR